MGRRVAHDYRIVAQAKKRRGALVQGRRVIAVDGLRLDLYRRGYDTAIFRRRPGRAAPGGPGGSSGPPGT